VSDTDFFDDDLVRRDENVERASAGRAEGAAEQADLPQPGDAVGRSVSDFNLTRMAQRKEEMNSQMATASEQLELLRQRQENIQREKRDLEELSRMQADFEQGKRDMVEKLTRKGMELEKLEVQTQRMAELYADLKERFRANLLQLQGIDEETWADEALRSELGTALAVIQDARDEYNRGQAKIEALSAPESEGGPPAGSVVFDDLHGEPEFERDFVHWVKVGFGLSFPIMLLIVVLFAIYMIASHFGTV